MAVSDASEPNLKMARMIRKSVVVEPKKNSRIMCVTYSYHGRHERVRTIKNTWANRCQGYLASSDLDDESISALNITHEGKEEYTNMWQKTRATMLYLEKNHVNQFDWFFFAGDDEYLIMENLQAYLASEELKRAAGLNFTTDDTPMLIGRRVQVRRIMFVSGGGGYLLSRAGLRLFVQKVIPSCRVHDHSSAEDVYLTECMSLHGALIPETQDAKGLTRFVAFSPAQYFGGKVNTRRVQPLCCSEQLITLHYLQPSDILWFDQFLYGGENNKSCL
jgi:glycoprotein-N-acetylgalactosamine 3-beta-galactosyltransferase